MKKENKISMGTNTAYLLNTWFRNPEKHIFKDVAKFIRKKHKEGWDGLNDQYVKVTFEIKNKLTGDSE